MFANTKLANCPYASTGNNIYLATTAKSVINILPLAISITAVVSVNKSTLTNIANPIFVVNSLIVELGNLNISVPSISCNQEASYPNQSVLSIGALPPTTNQHGIAQVSAAIVSNNNALPVTCAIQIDYGSAAGIIITAYQAVADNFKYLIGLDK
jgi:hypothetical protein